jgi:hypothetical protein
VGQFELACKADNVRAFLKDFKQYLREQYRQESIMDEQAFIKKHIKEHPNLIVNIAHLNAAVVTLREDYQRKLVDELRKQLRDKGVDLGNPVEDGQGGRNTHDWVVKTTMFGKTEIDIRIQADWSRGGFELRNGVSNNSAEVPTFYKLLQEAIRETEPNYGAGSGWYGGYYELSGRDCLSNERLAQLLESPKRLQEIVRDWVSRINKYIETVDWVCKEQQ